MKVDILKLIYKDIGFMDLTFLTVPLISYKNYDSQRNVYFLKKIPKKKSLNQFYEFYVFNEFIIVN